MSNGRSFSRRRRSAPGKSVRKNRQAAQRAYAESMRSQLDKMAKNFGEVISAATPTTGKGDDVPES